MIDYPEAKQEAERLKKMIGRDVEVDSINCDCDYTKSCYLCAGNGLYYELRYAFCNHVVRDDDRDEECAEFNCRERERIAASREPAQESTSPQLRSLTEVQSEQIEQEAA